jgi:hypothetical protein
MKFIVKKIGRKPRLRRPVLIEGLPGIGNVARIAVDFLIEKLNVKEYLRIYSYSFPNSVFIDDDLTVELPKVEIYYWKNPKGRDLVLLTGDVQPTETEDSYLLAEQILDIAQEIGVREIITLGGIGLPREPGVVRVFGAATHRSYIKKLRDCGVHVDGERTVGVIIGAAGLLLGLGKLRKMKGISLLGETFGHPAHFGIRASREVLKKLLKFLDIEIPLEDIDREILRIERRKARVKRVERRLRKITLYPRERDLRYIG